MDSTANRSAKPDQAAVRARRVSRFAAAALTIGLLAAGCGASSATRGEPSRAGAALAFTKCMRANGVPNLPDPGASVSGPSNEIGSIAIPSTIDIQSPAFQAAQRACHRLLAAVLAPKGREPISPALKESLLAHAQCMRMHGVPNYQDPRFPASGGIGFTDAGVDPQSPAYIHAQAVCGPG